MNWYLFVATLSATIAVHAHPATLCADIGGTRIKAAVLHANMSLDELKTVDVTTLPSKQWLNESLPQLFNATIPNSLATAITHPYESISFGITGPVVNSRLYINPIRFTIPRELADLCEKKAHMPVTLENDSTMWALGALTWLSLTHYEIQFPCLCITLGTGVGVALLKSPADITLIEISFLNTSFARLHALSQGQPYIIEYGKKSPHKPLGESFFEWAFSCSWNESMISELFNKRVIAFCKDLQEFLIQTMNLTCSNILLGGGNSRFIAHEQVQNSLQKKIILLSPQAITQHGISSDIISLLGCIHSLDEISICCIPAIETVFPNYVFK